jgi:hypothetical protein
VAIDVPVESSSTSAWNTPDLAGSPVNWPGINPPPSTPATRASTGTPAVPLEPLSGAADLDTIEEDLDEPEPEPTPEDKLNALVQHASNSKQGLLYSKHAPRVSTRPTRVASQLVENVVPGSTSTGIDLSKIGSTSSTHQELLQRMKDLNTANNANRSTTTTHRSTYQTNVIEKFLAKAAETNITPEVSLGDGFDEIMAKAEAEVKAKANMVKVEGVSDVEEPATAKIVKAEAVQKVDLAKVIVDAPGFRPASVEDEDRENQTFFTSWGTATPREGPKARVRSVILRNLPANCDTALVTSLVHGGALEELKLNKPAEGAVANAKVTFTDGDAADKYFDKYPNGIDFRYQGKRHTVFVDKGQEVDVISGLMRGYLETGATRVVRVVGADDDWGMKALSRVAAGKGRKVELITDSYRGGVSTIRTPISATGPLMLTGSYSHLSLHQHLRCRPVQGSADSRCRVGDI